MNEILSLVQAIGIALHMPTYVDLLEAIATIAAAISGIRLSSAKNFDLFGAYIIGVVTAVGGGTMRDLMLGIQPFWMTSSRYFLCCGLALLWVMAFGKKIIRQNNTWFIFDTIGLALFNTIGVEKSIGLGMPLWTAVTMGCVTGAAGGVLRDIFINEVPLIFRKEIYAMACIAGGIAYIIGLKQGIDPEVNALLSSAIVIAIRLLAVKFKWQLPILKGVGQE